MMRDRQQRNDRWAGAGATDAQVVAAVAEQRGFVMHMLDSRRWEADDVLAQVALDMVASMPRWAGVQEPRPSLGAWARGVAVRTFYAWVRSPGAGRGPGGATMVSTEVLAERGVSLPEKPAGPNSGSSSLRSELVMRLRRTVLQQSGGAALWDSMVTTDGKVRGKAASARLLLLLEVADPGGSLRRTAGLQGGPRRLADAGKADAA